jgi:GT2 family glycosyltransferase
MGAVCAVAVVIPSWNSAAWLPACLTSLKAEKLALEILVVDNGSTDDSVAILEAAGIRHIALPQNVGFAAAMNLGVGATSAPFVFGVNVDTVVQRGCVPAMLAAIEDDPGLGGVQPTITQLEPGGEARIDPGTRVYSHGQALTRDGRAYELGAGSVWAEAEGASEIFGVCGAAFLVRRELFEGSMCGFDERYFAFYEDVDLNVRARIAGWSFAEVPEAVVWHRGNASWQAGFKRPAADNARLVARNRLATQAKFLPATAIPRLVAVEVGSLLRAARMRRLRATLRGKLEVIPWLPALIRERRHLGRSGDLGRARHWLGRPWMRRFDR